jgi:hypothetical protein
VFVIGAPRSGTTVLSQVLSAHPDLALIGEPRFTWKHGNERRSDWLRAEDARPEVVRHIRRSFADVARAEGCDRILEKTPSNALRMPFVDRVFPDACYVHVIRNGIDSTVSIRSYWENFGAGLPSRVVRRRLHDFEIRRAPFYVKEVLRRIAPAWARPLTGRSIWGPELPGMQQMLREMTLEQVCALQWRFCVEEACGFGRRLDPSRYLEVRYEELNEEVLLRIARFAGIEPPEPVIEAFRETFGDRGRRSPDPGERSVVMERSLPILEPTLSWLGYETD